VILIGNINYKRLLPLLLAVLMFFSINVPVLASVIVPDVDKKGSVQITMKDPDTENGIPGGTLTLYRVAEVQVDDGNYFFTFTGDFSGCKLSLENIQSQQLVKDLESWVKQKKLTGMEKSIDKDGFVCFLDLELGLYLAIQGNAAEGYYAVNSFLVTVPTMGKGEWIYKVDATPKAEVKKAPDSPDSPGPSNPPESSNPPETIPPITPLGKLPQTGQLNWPIPVMTVIGLTLFAFGWSLRFTKKETCDAE